MRYLLGCTVLLGCATAFADDAQLKQWEKMDRCSTAAFIAVSILEESEDTYKQAIALQGALNGLKNNTKLEETNPTENEMTGAYNMALRISHTMPRPFDTRGHDWLVAQAATACTLWVPEVKPQ
ncbi:hypothetical protein PS834_00762 [Pseudomonas fluorescens]|nr:hypothetical protein PS834_00762 [Pseudomonas fluorescens]